MQISNIQIKRITCIIWLCFSVSVFSQNINQAEKDSIIAGTKKRLFEKYIYPEKAKLISDSLSSAPYAMIVSRDSFLKKLNQDLFRYSNDKHLWVHHNPVVAAKTVKGKDIHKQQDRREKREHYGMSQRKILEGNVGYLKLDYFAYVRYAQKRVLRYMRYFRDTRAIIIDLRGNFGGNPSMIQLLSGIFLTEEEGRILEIVYRSRDTVRLKSSKIKPEDQYLDKPVYVLCDSNTYSAAEAFALIMKNRHRAILIGETTAGAGNVAGPPFSIYGDFMVTLSVGKIVDPLTHTGWEQTGVRPDIIIESSKALERAIELFKSRTEIKR